MEGIRKIAVLIDGDNAENKLIKQILNAVGKYGKITIKRVYGDFSLPHTSVRWCREVCNTYAIRPVQKYSYASGKNAIDTELIIDAMDILHAHSVEGFCIVSSDSDYTGLASRIREEGLFIMGVGRRQTSEAFVKACEIFIFMETLAPAQIAQPELADLPLPEHIETATPKLPGVKIVGKIDLSRINPVKKTNHDAIDRQLVDKAFNRAVDKATGIVVLSQLNQTLKQIDSAFNYRHWGFSSFRQFCESLSPAYLIVLREDGTMSLKKAE
ncbi:MAG: NYN domain-containing protein [Prevotellaceae bacterium]|jgi:hypothetical protein|nr:NYN domain-containing protein [Prevotellaceae bacterium]